MKRMFACLAACGMLAAVVTGCSKAPQVQEPITRQFDSSKAPGLIVDLTVARADADAAYKEALAGAWYETLDAMRNPATSVASKTAMGKSANCSLESYEAQLKTTAMFWTPSEAAAYNSGKEHQARMAKVLAYCTGTDSYGVSYPDGTVQGNKSNVSFNFDSTYMERAAKNELTTTTKTKRKFVHAVSIYAGWMPWYYAKESGILKKWADKKGIEIELRPMNYIDSVNAFTTGNADSCTMANWEAFNMVAVSGVKADSILMGDYSNGNDALLTRGIKSIKELKGQEIMIVEGSVSTLLLALALESEGLTLADVKQKLVSDAQISAAFITDKSAKAVVTWAPMTLEIEDSQR